MLRITELLRSDDILSCCSTDSELVTVRTLYCTILDKPHSNSRVDFLPVTQGDLDKTKLSTSAKPADVNRMLHITIFEALEGAWLS